MRNPLIDPSQLRAVLTTPTPQFRPLGAYTETNAKRQSGYTFIDRGASVLGVAHLDSVVEKNAFALSRTQKTVWNPRLDDRLGVYTLLRALPRLGLDVDVLLTEDEEMGQSTAAYFETEKKYRWIVEFDRAGEDVVLYQYEDSAWRKAVKDAGFQVGWGSYSDISDLEHLGVKALNIGVGYYLYHTARAYADLTVWARNLQRFAQFYRSHVDTTFAHQPVARYGRYGSAYGAWGWNDDLIYAWPARRNEPHCVLCDQASAYVDPKSGLCWECEDWLAQYDHVPYQVGDEVVYRVKQNGYKGNALYPAYHGQAGLVTDVRDPGARSNYRRKWRYELIMPDGAQIVAYNNPPYEYLEDG